jgi:hypothetical protein
MKYQTQILRVRSAISIVAILILAAITHVAAQDRGTTRETAVLIQGNSVTDDLDGSADSYFYKFVAGPGKVTITLEVEANDTNAGATLDVFGTGTRPILSDVLAQGVDKGSERVERSFKLTKQQTIVIRIKGIKYGDGGTGSYTITLGDADDKKAGDPPKPNGDPQKPNGNAAKPDGE